MESCLTYFALLTKEISDYNNVSFDHYTIYCMVRYKRLPNSFKTKVKKFD